MSDAAIQVQGLGKQYRIGTRESYKTLRDTVTDIVSAPARRVGALFRGTGPDMTGESSLIWALRNVSFDVPQGSAVGIIGRNGAGKSTLLKVLSRITSPTEGRVEIHGRVGSLLEVGTGFHPELTGRENVFLNGAILGMKHAEVERKFDEIVSFAEVEKFIDTPVKHYSSGMYMRLAFAVAAHLETEILVVDEVLAVGDTQFQRKCLGKMSGVAKNGRTVLFVSHSMASVAALCTTAVLLDGGRVAIIGSVDHVIEEYMRSIEDGACAVDLSRMPNQPAIGHMRLTGVAIQDNQGNPCSRFQYGDDISIVFTVEPTGSCQDHMCVVIIRAMNGVQVLHLTGNSGVDDEPLRFHERVVVRCRIPNCQLYPGTYSVSVWVGLTPYLDSDLRNDVLMFRMEQGRLPGYGVDLSTRHALVHADSRWEVQPVLENQSAACNPAPASTVEP